MRYIIRWGIVFPFDGNNELECPIFDTQEEAYNKVLEDIDNDEIVSELLKEGLLFVNFRDYTPNKYDGHGGRTIVLFMICSDTFAHAYADAEDVENDEELRKLYKYFLMNNKWGPTQWVIEKRKRKVIESTKKKMVEEGVWKEEYEIY
jgi:hypothetical protein